MTHNFIPIAVLYSTLALTQQSTHLNRIVTLEVFLPAGYATSNKKYPLLILNDGQDSKGVSVLETLNVLVANNQIPEIIVVGVVAGDRMQEYGVAEKLDYKKRGSKASLYTKYITEELLPYIMQQFPVSAHVQDHAIAGYSLGGLSAVDIAWNHPTVFSKAGAFSGSFWWRKRDAKSFLYSDSRDRIMHAQIREGKHNPGLTFWFQTGTKDEQSDRNKNGIIDSIDDTKDLIAELTKKGYSPTDMVYYEMEGGEHNQSTWGKAMPVFLIWAFGRK